MDGYTVAPVQFSEKEANDLITAELLVKQSNDSSFVENFDEATTKIKSFFRAYTQEKSEVLRSKIHVFNKIYENISSNALAEIQLAIINLNFTEINYRKANDTNISFGLIT